MGILKNFRDRKLILFGIIVIIKNAIIKLLQRQLAIHTLTENIAKSSSL